MVATYGPDADALQGAVSAAFESMREVDAIMSVHREDSELALVNRTASAGPVTVSSNLFHVLAEAQAIAGETGGAFDATIRPLADLWGFIWKEYRMPTATELERVLPRVDYRLVALDRERSSVRFLQEGVSLDLGGIAKGFAVDLAIAVLEAAGATNVLVRLGGDVRVRGRAPGLDHWVVQLEDPDKAGRRLQIRLRDAAISTSGDYENFFVVEGRRYSHLLDPRTGLPVHGVRSCSVVAPTCLQSDGWATALFVLGAERGLAEFGGRFPMQYHLDSQEPGRAGPMVFSPGFPELLAP